MPKICGTSVTRVPIYCALPRPSASSLRVFLHQLSTIVSSPCASCAIFFFPFPVRIPTVARFSLPLFLSFSCLLEFQFCLLHLSLYFYCFIFVPLCIVFSSFNVLFNYFLFSSLYDFILSLFF